MSTATIGQDLWAASHLDDLEVKVSFDRRGRQLELREDNDGYVCRKAAAILIIPERRRAEIRLFKGASSGDLQVARQLVEQIQDGGIPLWMNEHVWDDGTRYWVANTFLRGDSRICHDYTLQPCEDPKCVKPFHEWLNDEVTESCSLERIEHTDGFYVVHGVMDPGKKWQAWIDADNLPAGHAGLKALRDALNDLAWMQVECDRLNGAI